MTIQKTISQTRRYLSKHKKGWATFFLGWAVGLILTPSFFYATATLFDNLSRLTLNILCLLFLIALFVTIPWIILLKSDLRRYKKYLKQEAPNLNIDSQEEHDEAWDEQAEVDKK